MTFVSNIVSIRIGNVGFANGETAEIFSHVEVVAAFSCLFIVSVCLCSAGQPG